MPGGLNHTSVEDAGAFYEMHKLNELRAKARKNSPDALKEAAKQFESIFIKMMLKSMRDASLGDPLLGSDQTKFYQQMFDDQIALNMATQGSIGLADMLVKQMSPPVQTESGSPDKHFIPIKSVDIPIPVNATDEIVGKAIAAYRDIQKVVFTPEKAKAQVHTISQSSDAPAYIDSIAGFQSPKQFATELWPLAQVAGKKLGLGPEVLIAQAALETGWGRFMSRKQDGSVSHNLFNIKAGKRWGGERAFKETTEFVGGKERREIAPFRAYESYEHSFQDYIRFLRESPRYQRALSFVEQPDRFVAELQRAGYATDPNYAKKVSNIMQRESIMLTGAQFEN